MQVELFEQALVELNHDGDLVNQVLGYPSNRTSSSKGSIRSILIAPAAGWR